MKIKEAISFCVWILGLFMLVWGSVAFLAGLVMVVLHFWQLTVGVPLSVILYGTFLCLLSAVLGGLILRYYRV